MAEPRTSQIRRKFEPLLRRGFHLYWRFARGLTFGVRGLVFDDANRVFLIKHTYVWGWHLPGGGVEVGETTIDALRRELKEEGNITFDGTPDLHGIFFNRHVSPRDHVAVYVIRAFQQESLPKPNREIAECGFFHLDDLPVDTTPGTRQRIAEVRGSAPIIASWRS